MNERDREKLARCSKAAQELFAKVSDPRRFYRCHIGGRDATTKAMQELIDAGLVGRAGRVNQLIACFVPKGTKPFRLEQFPGYTTEGKKA